MLFGSLLFCHLQANRVGPSSAAAYIAARFGHTKVGLPAPSALAVQEIGDAEPPAAAALAPTAAVLADEAPDASITTSSTSNCRRRGHLSGSRLSSLSSGKHSVYGSSPIGWRLRACVSAKANLGPNGNGTSFACRNAIDSTWDPEAARATPSALAEMVLTPLQRLRSGNLADMLQHFVFVVPKVNECLVFPHSRWFWFQLVPLVV